MVLLLVLCFGQSAVGDQVIYLRNQPVHLRQESGTMMLPLVTVRHLLTRKENERLKSHDGTVTVQDLDGESKSFPLVYGAVADWEEMLIWLGYNRRHNPDTGTLDFYTENTRNKTEKPEDRRQWESEEAAIARSERRPGYRHARKNFKKITAAIPLSRSSYERERVKRIGRKIADQSPLKDLHWTFEVLRTPVPNALCTGEGFVMVTTGLLALDLSDDELAGVLGHEVAHGVRRHAILYEERFQELMELNDRLDKLSVQLRQAEADGDQHAVRRIKAKARMSLPRLNFLVDFLKNKQSYDLHEEEEADVLGITYAAGAGYDPGGEARALKKLKKRSIEMFGQSIQKGSRTHPPLERRLEILSLVQSRWRNERRKKR